MTNWWDLEFHHRTSYFSGCLGVFVFRCIFALHLTRWFWGEVEYKTVASLGAWRRTEELFSFLTFSFDLLWLPVLTFFDKSTVGNRIAVYLEILSDFLGSSKSASPKQTKKALKKRPL